MSVAGTAAAETEASADCKVASVEEAGIAAETSWPNTDEAVGRLAVPASAAELAWLARGTEAEAATEAASGADSVAVATVAGGAGASSAASTAAGGAVASPSAAVGLSADASAPPWVWSVSGAVNGSFDSEFDGAALSTGASALSSEAGIVDADGSGAV